MRTLLAAAAATLALGATAAHATDYQLGTLVPGQVSSQAAVATTSGTTTDNFYFTLTQPYEAYASAGFIEMDPFSITNADLTLYNSSNVALTSTGAFDPSMTRSPTLSYALGAGTYHIGATVTVPTGKIGAYDVIATVSPTSAAPEPGTWALMLAGVAMAGFALRRSRQGSASLA